MMRGLLRIVLLVLAALVLLPLPVPGQATAAAQDRADEVRQSTAKPKRAPTITPLWTFGSDEAAQRWLQLFRIGQAAREGRLAPPVNSPDADTDPPETTTESQAVLVVPLPGAEFTLSHHFLSPRPDTDGVEAGGTVRQIGRFLVTIQDRRLFLSDLETKTLIQWWDLTSAFGEPVLMDRILVQDDLIVAAMSDYKDARLILTLVRLNQMTGNVSLEGRYAIEAEPDILTRVFEVYIAGGDLVVVFSRQISALEERAARVTIQGVQPVIGSDGWFEQYARVGRRVVLSRNANTFRPPVPIKTPAVVSVVNCPIQALAVQAPQECRARSFVAEQGSSVHVARSGTYILMRDETGQLAEPFGGGSGGCAHSMEPGQLGALASAVVRVPHGPGQPGLARLYGSHEDYGPMAEHGGRLWFVGAITTDSLCDAAPVPPNLRSAPTVVGLQSIPLDGFEVATTPTTLPSLHQVIAHPRFHYQFSGGRLLMMAADPQGEPEMLQAISLQEPETAATVAFQRGIRRIVPLQQGLLVISGSPPGRSLWVDYLTFSPELRVTSSLRIPGAATGYPLAEAVRVDQQPDGSVLIGLTATLTRGEPQPGEHWDPPSDLTFIRLSADSQLSFLGTLQPPGEQRSTRDRARGYVLPDSDYTCFLGCNLWTSNIEAVFYGGRTYALLGRYLLSTDLTGSTVRETGRIDLAVPPVRPN